MDGAITFHPLTPDRFADLESLFGTSATTRNCWCVYWRQTWKEWNAGCGDDRREALRARVGAGPPPGILAYRDGEAIGWVQVTPRADVPRFNRARSAKPSPAETDLDAVWAISCFFLRKDARGQGLMTALTREACAFAARQGAQAVEAAPVTPHRPLTWDDGYVGIASALERAGFTLVEKRSERRSLLRWVP
ncbi:GNAT family N-acetyltransferase [Roseospira visakhapatnamensis]|uniref:GNAT superfamily N-acetyltransferase n=1 Tax=Roseospira visakhapatnamensis TaxID=390880 RepID=A0A7W6RCW4_9PROT|nr:GNAT family N-acetyltransferase [Roseospira visakhapatnamensis]MBB4266122.1 GNAT superfamily N-acetyltransferase [Roseospira visakhapatnamensis]